MGKDDKDLGLAGTLAAGAVVVSAISFLRKRSQEKKVFKQEQFLLMQEYSREQRLKAVEAELMSLSTEELIKEAKHWGLEVKGQTRSKMMQMIANEQLYELELLEKKMG